MTATKTTPTLTDGQFSKIVRRGEHTDTGYTISQNGGGLTNFITVCWFAERSTGDKTCFASASSHRTLAGAMRWAEKRCR